MESGEQSTIVFLVDNVYSDGLPPKESSSRLQKEDRLLAQLKTVEDFPDRVVFIPGNQDWHSSGEKGLEFIRRQEQFIESYLDRGNTFLPDSGSLGPVSISLTQDSKKSSVPHDIQLIVLDTQWWLHPNEKHFFTPLNNENQKKKKILDYMKKMIYSNRGNEIVVAAHHPLFSNGRHGGNFPPSTDLLPPVFGSAYIAYRNIWGYHQDIANYSDLKDWAIGEF
jgi:hypothetical protein